VIALNASQATSQVRTSATSVDVMQMAPRVMSVTPTVCAPARTVTMEANALRVMLITTRMLTVSVWPVNVTWREPLEDPPHAITMESARAPTSSQEIAVTLSVSAMERPLTRIRYALDTVLALKRMYAPARQVGVVKKSATFLSATILNLPIQTYALVMVHVVHNQTTALVSLDSAETRVARF